MSNKDLISEQEFNNLIDENSNIKENEEIDAGNHIF